MADGSIEYRDWINHFEASEMAVLWQLIETSLRLSEPTDLKKRLLDLIEDQMLYMDYGLSVELDPSIGDDVDEFLDVLKDVESFVYNSNFPVGDEFCASLYRPEISRSILLLVYPEGTLKFKILRPVRNLFVLVATLNQRSASLLRFFGWTDTSNLPHRKKV
jgi:hypothetical protein